VPAALKESSEERKGWKYSGMMQQPALHQHSEKTKEEDASGDVLGNRFSSLQIFVITKSVSWV